MMNWHHDLSSILSETDGSVAKMRERLSARVTSPRATEDVYPVRDVPAASSSPVVHWSDLSAVQNQLHHQNQVIESLTQSVRSLERERRAQHTLIQTLEEELRSLQGAEESEQWRRDVTQEMSLLRASITGTQEESFSSKLRREELEHTRREMDSLRNKLMRLEEDVFQLQSEARETRRQNEHSSKTMERLSECQRTHSFEVAQTISQHKHTHQQVCELRVSVSELKDEVRGLILRDVHYTPAQPPHKQAVESRSVKRVESSRVTSESEDEFSLTASLAEISSDESWLEEADTQTKSRARGAHISSGLSGSDLSDAGSDLDDGVEGADGGSNSPPDLSLSDL